ncbi:MAG: site-specific integrase [Pseudomonadota bacterium]
MATLEKIGTSWRARVRRKGHKPLTKTFRTKAQAEMWATQREAEMARGEIVAEAGALTVGELINAYRALRDQARPISDTSNEHYMLRHLSEAFSKTRASALSSQDLVDYCAMRKEEGAGPYTCNMEISKLGTALRYAASYKRVSIPDAVGSARPLLAHLGLIGGGGKRERRTNDDELPRIVGWLRENKGPRYADAIEFAVYTTMRRGEVCRIVWADVNENKKLITIRDRKHPRKKIGNDELVPLLGRAWGVLKAQEEQRLESDDRIFPIHPQTLSKYFKEASDALGIPDLHLHDLRHEGTSQLFEQGYAIQQVALVTGHKDWRNLKRYTNLRPEDLHGKD